MILPTDLVSPLRRRGVVLRGAQPSFFVTAMLLATGVGLLMDLKNPVRQLAASRRPLIPPQSRRCGGRRLSARSGCLAVATSSTPNSQKGWCSNLR